MCRFYSEGKNGRKRFTMQLVFNVFKDFYHENVFRIFLPLGDFLACIRKNKSDQNSEPTQPKLFTQEKFWR